MKQRQSQQQSKRSPLFKEIRSLKDNDHCFGMAFNTDDSLFLAQKSELAQIFQFKNGFFKFLQNVCSKGHWDKYLTFFNQKQQFITQEEQFTRIWSINLMSSPKYLQSLQVHFNAIIVFNSEKQMITGSKVIKFWKIQNNSWYCSQMINELELSEVYGLSINDEGSTIVASCANYEILVLECNSTSNWLVIQKIQVKSCGYRLCFINNEVFTFQSIYQRQIILYVKNKQKMFTKRRVFKIDGGGWVSCPKKCCFQFPPIFNKNTELFINKNNSQLQIISFHKEQTNRVKWELKIEQQIKFACFYFAGTVTHNGDFLITFDRRKRIYQIWQRRGAVKRRRYQQNTNKYIN